MLRRTYQTSHLECATKSSYKLWQQYWIHAWYMHKWTLHDNNSYWNINSKTLKSLQFSSSNSELFQSYQLADWHSNAQYCCKTSDFHEKRFQREIIFQNKASKWSFYFRYSGSCSQIQCGYYLKTLTNKSKFSSLVRSKIHLLLWEQMRQ